MQKINIPAAMAALCKKEQKSHDRRFVNVYYDADAGALVATNGHIMLIERLPEPLGLPAGLYDPVTGTVSPDWQAGDSWLLWQQVDNGPRMPAAMPAGVFDSVARWVRKADAKKYMAREVGQINGAVYNLDYLKIAAAFLDGVPDAVAYNARGAEEDHRCVPLVMDRGARRVILMPMVPEGLEDRYNPAGAAAFADMIAKKTRAAAVVFVVVLPDGVHVFKNKTDAEQLAARYGATVAESVVM
jgi:hypothetical protein